MWKKVAYGLAGAVAVVALIAGIAITTYADNGQQGDSPPVGGQPWGGMPPANSALLDRVAQILNIDKQQLTDAFKQASSEARQKRTDDMFANWVSEGKLTQDQADQYKAWMASNPNPDIPCMSSQIMDKLLKDGKITQAQYDAYKGWMNEKPNIEMPKPQKPANMHGSHGSRWHGATDNQSSVPAT